MPYNVLIVDDESHARERLAKFIKNDSRLAIHGECENGTDAAEFILNQKPDIVFLDIQMPDLDGFGVIETVGIKDMPPTIFVTAYDQYAINAFKVNALDYVLKPVSRTSFEEASNRAIELLNSRKSGVLNEKLMNLLNEIKDGQESKPSTDYLQRIIIKSTGKMYIVKAEDIDWIEADDNYVKLHVGEKTHYLRQTMKAMEKSLDPSLFLRIHRSVIVNMDRISQIQQWFNNEYMVTLKNGTELNMSRTYREKAKKRFSEFS